MPGPMLGETAGSQRRLRLKGVVTKIKCNDIHLQVSPRAEHSRKTFHKDLKILVSQGFRSKAARSFVMSPHCVIYLLESRSPKGLPKRLAKHILSSSFFFTFLTFPKSWVLKEKKKKNNNNIIFLWENKHGIWWSIAFSFTIFKLSHQCIPER